MAVENTIVAPVVAVLFTPVMMAFPIVLFWASFTNCIAVPVVLVFDMVIDDVPPALPLMMIQFAPLSEKVGVAVAFVITLFVLPVAGVNVTVLVLLLPLTAVITSGNISLG